MTSPNAGWRSSTRRQAILILVSWLRLLEQIKLAAISAFIFVAWIVAAQGWLRAVAVVWLIYPAYVAWHLVRDRPGT